MRIRGIFSTQASTLIYLSNEIGQFLQAKEETCSLIQSKNRFLSLELLGGFEPPTSSLPSDWKPRECRCSALSGPFCFGDTWSLALSRPLTPSGFFRVWVTVWVKAQGCDSSLYRRSKYLPTSSQKVTAPENSAFVSATEQI